MSLFKRLVLGSDIPVGEDLIFDEQTQLVGRLNRAWEARFAYEEQLLRKHKLPLPKREPLTYNLNEDGRSVWVNKPVFTLPPYLTYEAFKPCVGPGPNCSADDKREWMAYVISGGAKEIERAKDILESRGIAALLAEQCGTWFNRDPYQMYHDILFSWTDGWWRPELTDYDTIHSHIKKLTMLALMPRRMFCSNLNGEPAPLVKVEGYSEFDMQKFQERIDFYNHLSYVAYKPFLRHLAIAPVPENKRRDYTISDEVMFSLKVPEPQRVPDEVVLKIQPPPTTKASVYRNFYNSLHSIKQPISLEFVDTGETAYFQLLCGKTDLPLVQRSLELCFPDATIAESKDEMGDESLVRASLRLETLLDETIPLSTFTIDPLSQFISVMDHTRPGSKAILQVICEPFDQQILNSVPNHEWPRTIIEGLEKKLPVWTASVNLFASDAALLGQLRASFLNQFTLSKENWAVVEQRTRINSRITKSDMLLSAPELAAFAHFPVTEINCDRLQTASMKQRLPPEIYSSSGVEIGVSEARGMRKNVTLPAAVRDRHLYVVGKSGTGKSTLIFNAALQDIQDGSGVAVIDPHGDLVATGEHSLLHYIPEHRVNDVIYLNAADKEHPIGMNLMAVNNDEELDLLATNLQTTFRRLSDSWGERMDNLLRFALHTLVQTPGSTFFDLKRLLQNAEYRKSVVAQLSDYRLVDFWQNDFIGYKDSIQPIISRMGKFMLSPLYGMLSQPESRLNFFDVIHNRKVLLVNLGGIGEDDAQLLGSLLVSQLQLAVMQRAKVPPEYRHPYYLYVDEFQNFTSRAFAKILSEARKYQLCLTLAHQFISQLGESERDAIFGNIATMIMFGVGDKDAQTLRHQLGKYEPIDLANLPKYQALCRPEQANDTFLFTTNPPAPRPRSFGERIIEHTRSAYAAKPVVTQRPAPASNPAPETRPGVILAPVEVAELKRQVPVESMPSPQEASAPPLSEREPSSEESTFEAEKVTASEPLVAPMVRLTSGVASLGRGGQQHKYLQNLIKRLAEDKGHRVIIEQPVLGGVGSVDVSLERNGRRIACEISVSSTADYEFQNLQKCLAAGFDEVILLSSERRALTKIAKKVKAELSKEASERIHFFLPEEFVEFLEQSDQEQSTAAQTVRGYKVKVKYKRSGDSEHKAQQKAVAQVMLQALKRLKSDK